MNRNLFYVPNYRGWTKAERERIKRIKGHENILELFEHGILSKTETIAAFNLLYRTA